MTPTEALALCRMVQAVCPHQKFDEMTPDTWGLVLAHVRFVDAQEALVAIAQRQPFVAPAEIIAEVKRIRGRRLTTVDTIQPPPGVEDELAYRRWLAETRRSVADGAPMPEPKQLPARDMRVVEGTFRQVPAEDDPGWNAYQQARTEATTQRAAEGKEAQ